MMQQNRSGRSGPALTSGPARLCQALDIDRRFDGQDLCAAGAALFVEQGGVVPDEKVLTGPRIGVRGDETALTAPWRFHVRGSRFVSR